MSDRKTRAQLQRIGPRFVRIDFACNDPDTGNFAGQVERIELPADMAELEIIRYGTTARFRDERERIILSGRSFAYERSKEYFGNWCWNAYWLTIEEATRFLIWLQSTRRWDCSSGWSEFYGAFNDTAPLDAIALGAWLAQAAAQERA